MCHARRHAGHHHRAARADWPGAARSESPVVPEPHDLRASDAERERTVEELRRHAAAGRLDADELEERLGLALGARTRAELAALLTDLPRTAAAAQRPRTAPVAGGCATHGRDPWRFVPIAVLLVAIWALTGAGYFWPVWPLMWFAFAALLGRRAGNTSVIR